MKFKLKMRGAPASTAATPAATPVDSGTAEPAGTIDDAVEEPPVPAPDKPSRGRARRSRIKPPRP